MNEPSSKNIAGIILRVGLGLVMLWFGTSQLGNASQWVGYLPSWVGSLPISSITFVHMNGWFELVFGSLLILGFYTRIIAFVLTLHLFSIAVTVGYNEIGVRDFGLSMSLLALVFAGGGDWSLDHYFK